MGSIAMPSPQQRRKTSPIAGSMFCDDITLNDVIIRLKLEASNYEDLRLFTYKELTRLRREMQGLIKVYTSQSYLCYPFQRADVDKKEQHFSYTTHMVLLKNTAVTFGGGKQFNIDAMFTDFVRRVEKYEYWKPGMKISVSLVPREQIPSVLAKGIGPENLERSIQDQRGGDCSQGALDFRPQSRCIW